MRRRSYATRERTGDVVAIYNDDGTKVLSYAYDAWGNFTVTEHVNVDPWLYQNPFTYRGYLYMHGFGMYYLGTRWYDPAIGRFISPDSLISGTNGSLHGFNLYAYCFNNPVNMTDESGNWPKWVKDAVDWIDKKIVKQISKTVEKITSNKSGTYSTGISVSATPGATVFNAQVGIALDIHGNVAIQTSIGGGLTTGSPGASISSYHGVTTASNVDDLQGSYYQVGASGSTPIHPLLIAGGDIVAMPVNDTTQLGLTGNIGIGTPGSELHVEWGETKNWITFNLFDFLHFAN